MTKPSAKAATAVPFLGKLTTSNSASDKPDFSRYKPFRNLIPRKFVTDSGREFDVVVLKSNIASYKLNLLDESGQIVNTLKIRKLNPRLRYLDNGNLLTPQEIVGR